MKNQSNRPFSLTVLIDFLSFYSEGYGEGKGRVNRDKKKYSLFIFISYYKIQFDKCVNYVKDYNSYVTHLIPNQMNFAINFVAEDVTLIRYNSGSKKVNMRS